MSTQKLNRGGARIGGISEWRCLMIGGASNKYLGHLTYFMVIQDIFSKFVENRGTHIPTKFFCGVAIAHPLFLAPPLDGSVLWLNVIIVITH